MTKNCLVEDCRVLHITPVIQKLKSELGDLSSEEVNEKLSKILQNFVFENQGIQFEIYNPGKQKTRWACKCPQCEKLKFKLYQPPNAERFLCRECHGLTYYSSTVSWKKEYKLLSAYRKYAKVSKELETAKRQAKKQKLQSKLLEVQNEVILLLSEKLFGAT